MCLHFHIKHTFMFIFHVLLLWLSPLGPASAGTPFTTCLQPGRGESPTRSDQRQSCRPPSLPWSTQTLCWKAGSLALKICVLSQKIMCTRLTGHQNSRILGKFGPSDLLLIPHHAHPTSLLIVLTCFCISLKDNRYISGAHACMWVTIEQFVFVCECVCECMPSPSLVWLHKGCRCSFHCALWKHVWNQMTLGRQDEETDGHVWWMVLGENAAWPQLDRVILSLWCWILLPWCPAQSNLRKSWLTWDYGVKSAGLISPICEEGRLLKCKFLYFSCIENRSFAKNLGFLKGLELDNSKKCSYLPNFYIAQPLCFLKKI